MLFFFTFFAFDLVVLLSGCRGANRGKHGSGGRWWSGPPIPQPTCEIERKHIAPSPVLALASPYAGGAPLPFFLLFFVVCFFFASIRNVRDFTNTSKFQKISKIQKMFTNLTNVPGFHKMSVNLKNVQNFKKCHKFEKILYIS